MTEEIKLKPCPFCGGEAEIIDDAIGTISRCRRCGAENGNGVYGAEGHKLAVKDWNARPIEDALQAENKRLCEALELIKKTGNEYPHDGNGCAYIAELALCGLNVIEEWEKIGREADEE